MSMLRSCQRLLVGVTLGLASLVSGCASMDGVAASRLELVKLRGELLCGVSGKIPGFSFLSPEGAYTGLDVDICRAMAAAIVGDANRVQFRPLTAPERFTALRSGEIDLLSRNTTATLSREGQDCGGLMTLIEMKGMEFDVARTIGKAHEILDGMEQQADAADQPVLDVVE